MEATTLKQRGLTVMLPDDLWTDLKQLALDEKTTAKKIVIDALRKHVPKRTRR